EILSNFFGALQKQAIFCRYPSVSSLLEAGDAGQSDEGADMDTQRTEGPGAEPGFEAVEANGVRLATSIDPRLAEVWTTLFAADLDATDLSEQVGWFLRMAYL